MTSWYIRLFLLLILALVTAAPCMAAGAYQVQSGYANPPGPFTTPIVPKEIPVWELPFGTLVVSIVCCLPEFIAAIKIWAALGYRRVSRSNVLEQEIRSSVFSTIQGNPGIHLHGLARETKTRLGTLRHHLQMLCLMGKITKCRDSGTVCFFENNGAYTRTRKLVLKHLHNETRKRILDVLKKDPSAGRNEIAAMLGFTGATITWHMKRLEEDRIVCVMKSGRTVRYLIPVDVSRCLDEYLPA
ncbi:MAG: winged helix-turn-helix transcriptional regulator [Methanoregula sp.]